MANINDNSGLEYQGVSVDELQYMERIIDEIEEYFEYMRNEEEVKVSDTTTKILEDVSNGLYEKTQHIRRSICLPRCLIVN